MTPALIACDRPRFADSELQLGQFEAQGPVLCLVGVWAPLFRLVAGQQGLSGGSLTLCGQAAEGAAGTGHVGLWRADAPLPLTWTLADALLHSGGLLGLSRREAAARGRDVARELGLLEQLNKPLGRSSLVDRRIAGIALAVLGEPAVLALEEPFSGLDPSAGAQLSRALGQALRGRRALVSMAELPGSVEADGFVQTSSEILFASERGMVARARYAELSASASHYRVVVLRHAEELCKKLGELGYTVQSSRAADGLGLLLSEGAARGTAALLEAALSVDAPIVELSPVRLTPRAPAAATGAGTGA